MVEAGHVYALINSYMPDLIKIGITTGTVDDRARGISAVTGVPGQFEILHSIFVSNCRAAESDIHQRFGAAGKRVNDRREFFAVTPNEVFEVFAEISARYPPVPRMYTKIDPVGSNAQGAIAPIRDSNKSRCPSCNRAGEVQKVSAIHLSERQHARKKLLPLPQQRVFKSGCLGQAMLGLLALYLLLNRVPRWSDANHPISKFMFDGYLIPRTGSLIPRTLLNDGPQAFIRYLNSAPPGDKFGAALLILAFVLVLISILARIITALINLKNKPSFDRAMTRWNDLFYCKNCNCVFYPNDNKHFPPEHLKTILYKD